MLIRGDFGFYEDRLTFHGGVSYRVPDVGSQFYSSSKGWDSEDSYCFFWCVFGFVECYTVVIIFFQTFPAGVAYAIVLRYWFGVLRVSFSVCGWYLFPSGSSFMFWLVRVRVCERGGEGGARGTGDIVLVLFGVFPGSVFNRFRRTIGLVLFFFTFAFFWCFGGW